ncbi:MAG: hypothetical protein QW244_00405 [Candidatus Pacearchaeota archaeon]
MALEIEKLIKGIIGLMAFIVIILIIIIAARTIYSGITFPKEEILQKTEFNREVILRNFEDCSKIDDTNCFCEIFPSQQFPAVLPKWFSITIENKDGKSNISILLNEKILDRREIKSEVWWWGSWRYKPPILFIQPYLSPLKGKIEFEEYPKLTMDVFRREKVEKDTISILSGDALKIENRLNFLTEYIKVEESKKVLDELREVKCTEGRYDSINFFENLRMLLLTKNRASQPQNVKIGENFVIIANKTSIGLYDKDGNIVKSLFISISYLEEKGDKQIEISKFEEVIPVNLLCGSEERIELRKDDKVKLMVSGNQACIEKIEKI